MKSKSRKRGGAYRNAKMLNSLYAKQGKDRTRRNRQDKTLEEKVKLRGIESGKNSCKRHYGWQVCEST